MLYDRRPMPGTLYVVSTPIGNLQDVTYRAVDVLTSVAVIACEDTRTTRKLLSHRGIRTSTLSYHEHNESRRAPRLIATLLEGKDVALVSDAGTPLVSDPGYRLVRAARDEGIPVRAVPGASALLAALVVSGLPTSRFTFIGFVPSRGSARKKALSDVAALGETVVVFESPARLERLLAELAELAPRRRALIARELTKRHEDHHDGSLEELAAWAKGRRFQGEITLVIGPAPAEPSGVTVDSLESSFRELRERGLSAREASKRLAREHGVSAREVYNRFGR